MEMIQARSRDGLCLLRERHVGVLRKISREMLRNEADVEELLQDVFVEIWNRAASYDAAKGRPIAWIVTLTRRRSIDRGRRRDTYTRAWTRFAEETEAHSDRWTHVYEDVARSERHEYLGRALAVLPAAQRDAIRLAYYGQMTQREVAAHTGWPLGTVKTRLELGLKKMAVFLRGFEDLLEKRSEVVKLPAPDPSAQQINAPTVPSQSKRS